MLEIDNLMNLNSKKLIQYYVRQFFRENIREIVFMDPHNSEREAEFTMINNYLFHHCHYLFERCLILGNFEELSIWISLVDSP